MCTANVCIAYTSYIILCIIIIYYRIGRIIRYFIKFPHKRDFAFLAYARNNTYTYACIYVKVQKRLEIVYR